MSVLLHIDSSPLGPFSISRHLSARYVEDWKKATREGTVITRDLNRDPIPAIDASWIEASYAPVADRTQEQKEILAFSDSLLAELRAADEYVIATPMHNFTISSALRLWIDQIVRAGETFSYGSEGPVGLLTNKKATVIFASGGVYDKGSPTASYNFVEPYLRTVFGFLGVTDISFYGAGGAAAIMQGKADREEFLKMHAANIRTDFSLV